MPTNHVLARMGSLSGDQEAVKGSILIMKQTQSVRNAITNRSEDEIVLIKEQYHTQPHESKKGKAREYDQSFLTRA